MANSSIIGDAKNRLVREFIRDEDIILAIGDNEITSTKNSDKLINTHIFTYNQNPNTLNTVGTFITIQVHIPRTFDFNASFVEPVIDIWIVSHEKHMIVDNIPKITENRNDYISRLIDNKINGSFDFGLGGLYLESNIEGVMQKDYLYRQMTFKCKDLNKSLCFND